MRKEFTKLHGRRQPTALRTTPWCSPRCYRDNKKRGGRHTYNSTTGSVPTKNIYERTGAETNVLSENYLLLLAFLRLLSLARPACSDAHGRHWAVDATNAVGRDIILSSLPIQPSVRLARWHALECSTEALKPMSPPERPLRCNPKIMDTTANGQPKKANVAD